MNSIQISNNETQFMFTHTHTREHYTLNSIGLLAYVIFPFLSLNLASLFNDAGVFAVLSQDSSQFVQNFLTVSGLLFSILVGQTFYFMYQQQEQIYLSLFSEVTEVCVFVILCR